MFASGKTNAVANNAANYIEDVFSTYLYTGTNATRSINNGIDLSTKGGMVWFKNRNTASYNHDIFDTVRGATNFVRPNLTSAQFTDANTLTAFNTNGFSLGSDGNGIGVNQGTSNTYASWTFRKQPKFFDVVTFTTNSFGGGSFTHSLGSVPGCAFVKCTSTTEGWLVSHRSLTSAQYYLVLNTTAAQSNVGYDWLGLTSTGGTIPNGTLVSSANYVVYLFAHNAGGFGLTGTDNVISCGSYTGTAAAGNVITLGYEPQLLIIKNISTTGNWQIIDNMRGMSVGSNDKTLQANITDGDTFPDYLNPTSTGFELTTVDSEVNGSNTYIYIAIRRGPMKVPTTGTSVYKAISRTGTGTTTNITGVGFTPDLVIDVDTLKSSALGTYWWDRLRGAPRYINTNSTGAEQSASDALTGFDLMDGVTVQDDTVATNINQSGINYINWFFKRASNFFDEICWKGTGSAHSETHNLGAVPTLLITKSRGTTGTTWFVYNNFTGTGFNRLELNTTVAATTYTWANAAGFSSAPTSSDLPLSTGTALNGSGRTYVAYLFATCAGVSKVGSYTGTGTTKQIDCGFTGGARFVLIKRTDSTGDWYVWDTTRGIVSGNDPYLLWNGTNAQVTTTDYIDPYSAGFEISSTAPAAINASGGTFIFLAIA